MTDFDKIREELFGYFRLRGYQESTIKLYSKMLIELFKYYPTTDPSSITLSQIHTYINVLVTRKLSYSSVNQFFQAADYYYNHINRKDYRLNRRLLPIKKETITELLSQEQVFLIIDNIQNIKHKAIVTLLYSCGLDIKELIKLRLTDIKSNSKPPKLLIRENDNKVLRQAIISEKVLKLLRDYWHLDKPKVWLFEGQTPSSQYSERSVRAVIEQAFESAGFPMDSEAKVLRKTYIKHMVELGVPLIVVMNHLGLRSFDSVERYTKLIHGDIDVSFSPIDKIVGKSEIKEIEIDDLESLIFSLENDDEKEYLREALSCFRVGALRAGIVFSWVAGIRFIQNKCIELGYNSINNALQKSNSGAKKIKGLDDFETLKDLTILSIGFELGVISKHQRSQLENNLDLRNHCGHPSSYSPEINKARAFIEDIVNLMKKK